MSVVKSKRTKSRFEVLHHLFIIRRQINDLILYDFSFTEEKATAKLLKNLGISSIDEMDEKQRERYEKQKRRWDSFQEWLIVDERKEILDCLRDITQEIFLANSIYPIYWQELMERRIHQDRAIGGCERLLQELFYVITTLPVDHNIYTRFSKLITEEIGLIKQWRKSDNRFKANIQGAQIEPQSVNDVYIFENSLDTERKAASDDPYIGKDMKDKIRKEKKEAKKLEEWTEKVFGKVDAPKQLNNQVVS